MGINMGAFKNLEIEAMEAMDRMTYQEHNSNDVEIMMLYLNLKNGES